MSHNGTGPNMSGDLLLKPVYSGGSMHWSRSMLGTYCSHALASLTVCNTGYRIICYHDLCQEQRHQPFHEIASYLFQQIYMSCTKQTYLWCIDIINICLYCLCVYKTKHEQFVNGRVPRQRRWYLMSTWITCQTHLYPHCLAYQTATSDAWFVSWMVFAKQTWQDAGGMQAACEQPLPSMLQKSACLHCTRLGCKVSSIYMHVGLWLACSLN